MIGVIAALTLPTLMNSTNDKEVVARVKKTHAMLNEAYGRAYAKYAPISTWFRDTDNSESLKAERIGKRFCEFLQVEKDCDTNITGCFNSINYLSGKKYIDIVIPYKVVLSDGTAVAFNCSNGVCNIPFDIDGPKKGKSRIGIDMFILGFGENKSDLGSEKTITDMLGTDLLKKCRADEAGALAACFVWIKRYDNIDYLYADDHATCSNGTILSDTNPTCN